jgi:hypothetical protein
MKKNQEAHSFGTLLLVLSLMVAMSISLTVMAAPPTGRAPAAAMTTNKSSVAASAGKEQIEYKYKSREVYDFNELSIHGNFVSPGDLSLKSKNERKRFISGFKVRQSMDAEMREDFNEIK